MQHLEQIGSPWGLIDVEHRSGHGAFWVGHWSLHTHHFIAQAAMATGQVNAGVSGRTAVFATREDAFTWARMDATRTERVLSGTYRD